MTIPRSSWRRAMTESKLFAVLAVYTACGLILGVM